MAGAIVRQYWVNKSLEFGEHFDETVTNPDGYVHFPRRMIYYPLAYRLPATALRYALLLAHGSVGVKAYITAMEYQFNEASWAGEGPLPEKIIVTPEMRSKPSRVPR